MASAVQSAASPARTRNETVVDFVPEVLAAPFFLRCGALFIDYMVLMVVPIGALMWNRFLGDGSAYAGPGTGLVTLFVILWLIDFILLPLLLGQTIGKLLTGLRILRLDGTPAGLWTIIKRNILGYFLTGITLGLGFLGSVFSSRGRALHDFIGGTIVISGQRKQL